MAILYYIWSRNWVVSSVGNEECDMRYGTSKVAYIACIMKPEIHTKTVLRKKEGKNAI
jgi:hypothetical protein